MPGYTGTGKNIMLDALTAAISHVGLFSSTLITGVTGNATTDLLTKIGHGLANGDIVTLTGLAGGTGLFDGDPYYVVGVSGNDFQLARTAGGAAIDFTTTITGVTVVKLTELSGGSPAYARKAIAFNAAGNGTVDDSTNGAVFDVPGGVTVSHVGYWSAISAGTLRAIGDITDEAFAGQGNYTLTDADLDLNNS